MESLFQATFLQKGANMKRIVSVILSTVLCLTLFTGCSDSRYDVDWIIGKTSAEIIDKYGEFDCTYMWAGNVGLYRSKCGYTIKDPQRGFLGTSPEVLLFINFDENGIAVDCEKGSRPGG